MVTSKDPLFKKQIIKINWKDPLVKIFCFYFKNKNRGYFFNLILKLDLDHGKLF